ncbi:MAG: apolipoprotein N-acyltransferase [Spirochaetaceae bacterium]|jgi:apolipoprotein N-acyltransferase|nr:apolipoprotein N-acyltransferase [Spirochaetaceae bacterium]
MYTLSGNKIFSKKTGRELLLLISAVLLFALSFPNFLNRWGFPFLAYFSLIPVFILVHRSGFIKSTIYGGIYGYLSYALFNFWLAVFNPNAFIIVPVIYMFYFMALFPLLKLADKLFPKNGYFLQVLLWLSYEYLRTLGFNGYSYGVLGYSQYNFTSLIGIADIAGVVGVSLLIVFPSAIIGHAMHDGINTLKVKFRSYLFPIFIWIILFSGSIIYSAVGKVDYSKSPVWRTALIQHNIDSWRKGFSTFKAAVDSLIRITDESLKENPDIIIWSETAYVPAIEFHLKYRDDRDKVELTQEVMRYIETLNVPIILGNNDTVKHRTFSEDYNAMLMIESSTIVNRYRKIHLVPYGEHFPYGKAFPWLDKIIRDSGASRFDAGTEYTIFEQGDIRFGGLICFEDTFGYLTREFVKRGADVLVNITNDSWSLEPVASIQHMGMAVFRSIENRRSMVRSTNGGFTTVIDPNGKRISELEPFVAAYLVENVPVYTDKTTLYTRWGDWLNYFILLLTFCGFTLGFLIKYSNKKYQIVTI